MKHSTLLLAFGVALLPPAIGTAAAPAAPAAARATGTVSGRIYNPYTGEYVRNAEVRIEGTQLNAVSEDDGSYSISGVAAGDVVLVVNYTGYREVRLPIALTPGGSLTRDVELQPSLGGRAAAGDKEAPITLEAFVVSSEREGNAKAIMSQRNSMNITNSVASDVFGDVAEGNIGEFLKHMSGVELDTVEGDVRTVRLRGLAAEYTAVTMDGVSLASADANKGTDGAARAFSFEQVSLNSMDSIEVSKTVSADVDANAPAGTINLKTKRAFDRGGRRLAWQTNLTALSYDMTLAKTAGPDNTFRRKLLPGGMFEYSDVFLNKRLGVVLNVSESQVYSISPRSSNTFNYTTTATDARLQVPATIAQIVAPRITERFTTTLTVDYKINPRLNVGTTVIYNYNDLTFHMRTVTFTTGTRAKVLGDEPMDAFVATGSDAKVAVVGQGISKGGETWTVLPKFEYKLKDLTIEGRFALSDSASWYNPMGRRGLIFSTGSMTVSGITYKGVRSSRETAAWDITQLTGPSWSDGASFSTPSVIVDDGRTARAQIQTAEVVGSFNTKKLLPIRWKSGVKMKRDIRDYQESRGNYVYNYTGPGAGTGAWKDYRLPYNLDFGLLDASVVSNTGGAIYVPDIQKIAELYREHPDYFKQTQTATNYYDANIGSKKHYVEDVNSAFLMGTTSVGRFQFRAGMRFEDTLTDSLEPDPVPADELRAAGYAEKNGQATTIEGLQYQYFSKPNVHRKGRYGYFFPSGSAKYRFTRNLDLHLGYSRTIRRPTFQDITGVWTVNDDALNVSAPNVNLKPETSKNLSARLAYYFEPVGLIAVSAYQNTVKGLFVTQQMTAQEFGYDGPQDLSNYTFTTVTSSADTVRIRGMEWEYSQSLSFLPKPFSGLNVRATYTRNQAERTNPGMAPHAASAGLNYTIGRVNVYASANWLDEAPLNAANTSRKRHRTFIDLGGSVKLRSHLTLFWMARNITNAPFITIHQREGLVAAQAYWGAYGTNWTFGLKGTF